MRDTPSILHVDMDAFFASVEILEHPELADKPVVVGGSGARGVVASCNYEARRYGIRSAMPSRRAQRLCPRAVFVDGNYGRYEEYSKKMHAILEEFTPLVEMLSIDEAFMDVAGAQRLWGPAEEIAHKVRATIRERLRLSACVGAATTKHLAKIASVDAKPKIVDGRIVVGSGVKVVTPEQTVEYLHPLPIRRLWGVGPKTSERLEHNGIHTVADIARMDMTALRRIAGEAGAEHLAALAANEDDREVVAERGAKSIGHEQTFVADLKTRDEVNTALLRLSDAVASRLRTQQMAARTLSVKIRFADFETISRAFTLEDPAASTAVFSSTAQRLADQIDIARGVRLLGVSVSNLSAARDPESQLTLDLKLDGEDADHDRVDEVVDDIRRRFGSAAVMPATLAGNNGRGVLRRGERQWGPSKEDENKKRSRG